MSPAGRWPEREIAELAARQDALITYQQLIDLGVGRSAIWRAVQRGRLYRLHPGIYAVVSPAVLPRLGRERAALLACGERTTVGRRSAAAAWGMGAPPEEVEVLTVGHDRGRKLAGVKVYRAARLDRADVRRHRGLPCTAPAKTLLDITPLLSDRELERTVDEAIAKRIVSRAAIFAVLQRYPRQKGCGRLRRLCDTDTVSRSSGEKLLLKLLRRAKLRLPQTNARFGRFEVDFLWRREKVAVELDGYDFHSSRAALERDHAKDLALQAAGFTIIRVTGRQLAREPELVLAWIVAALARGTADQSLAG